MITQEEYDAAKALKDKILAENRARLAAITVEQETLTKNYGPERHIFAKYKEFQQKMAQLREEITEIHRRNHALVQEWINVDNEFNIKKYQSKTLQELEPVLRKAGIEVF